LIFSFPHGNCISQPEERNPIKIQLTPHIQILNEGNKSTAITHLPFTKIDEDGRSLKSRTGRRLNTTLKSYDSKGSVVG